MLRMTERKYESRKLRKEDERRVEENGFGLNWQNQQEKQQEIGHNH
jgi:hypothetical protein